jgi:Hemerythrin HHE cation binding domain
VTYVVWGSVVVGGSEQSVDERVGSVGKTRAAVAADEGEPGRGHVDLWSADPLDEAARPVVTLPSDTGRGDRDSSGTGQRLVMVHRHLREELRQIRDAVGQVADGLRDAAFARSLINELTLRQNFWTLGSFCASYCRILTTHHTIEDQYMYPELVGRQSSLAPVVEQLEREHEVIAGVLAGLDAALVALVADDSRIDDVRDHVELLDRVLTSHLDYEEAQLVEPLDRLAIDI